MKARLNITIEASLIQRIKVYASQKHLSVSQLTEDYFYQLTSKKAKKQSIFDFLEKETIQPVTFPENFDFKIAYRKHLDEKYGE